MFFYIVGYILKSTILRSLHAKSLRFELLFNCGINEQQTTDLYIDCLMGLNYRWFFNFFLFVSDNTIV